MNISLPNRIRLDARLTAKAPVDVVEAVEQIARVQQLSPADFIRSAVSDKLLVLGVPHTRTPPLRRR